MMGNVGEKSRTSYKGTSSAVHTICLTAYAYAWAFETQPPCLHIEAKHCARGRPIHDQDPKQVVETDYLEQREDGPAKLL
jgi:hypothetical protein